MDTKLGKVVTHQDRLPTLMSYDSLITWPTWGHVTNWKNYISIFKFICCQSLTGWWLWEGSECKHLSCHQLLVFSFSFSVFLGRLAKCFCAVFLYCCSRHVWFINRACHVVSWHTSCSNKHNMPCTFNTCLMFKE